MPWTIKSILKNEWLGYFLFSFLMAVMAYTMIPYDTMDITRHYEAFEIIKSLQIDNIPRVFDRFWNYALNYYMWFVSHLGLPKEFVPFSFIFIIFMLYFKSYQMILFKKSSKIRFIVLSALSIFMIVNQIRFIDVTSGLRNGMGFAVFLYAVIGYYFRHFRFKLYILSIIAILIHMSVIPLFLLFILSNIFTLKNLGRILFIISFIVLILGLSSMLFYAIIGILEPFLRANSLYFPAYMDSNAAWGAGFYADKNIKTIILEKVIKPLPFYLAGVYLFYVKQLFHEKIQNYLYMLFIFIALVSISNLMLDRFSWFFVMLFIYLLIIELQTKGWSKFRQIFLSFFIISLLLMDFSGVVKYRDTIAKSWTQMFYKPAPFLFLEHIDKTDYIHRESL